MQHLAALLLTLLAFPVSLPAQMNSTAKDGASAIPGAATHAAKGPIPFSEIGAKATADYQGDALSITATSDGARLARPQRPGFAGWTWAGGGLVGRLTGWLAWATGLGVELAA